MHKKRWTAALVVALMGLATAAQAADRGDGLHEAVRATAAFHDFDKAQAAGHTAVVLDTNMESCITNPGVGTMGEHYLDPAKLDGTVDAAAPEVLVYEPRHNGHMRLVALEYLVFVADWEAAGNVEPPSLFGQEFDLVTSPNRYGAPDFYALHAWIWAPNPLGMFAMWNPRVSCPPDS